MLSMTGFGNGTATTDGTTVAVELRSVNHRYLDVALRLPTTLSFLEGDVRAALKERVARGRVTCSVQLEHTDQTTPVVMDPVRLAQGVGLLKEAADRLTKATGETQTVRLEHLLAVPDLLQTAEPETDEEELRGVVRRALDGAIDGLLETKAREGGELAAEMSGRLAAVRTQLAEVVRVAPRSTTEAHERLTARVAQLQVDEVDPQRLAQEVAILADRANINEECERLSIHVESFQETIDGGGQVAKRLNFLLQEMHREVNTMGSKTNLMDITQRVITMKEEIESMREQVLNLE